LRLIEFCRYCWSPLVALALTVQAATAGPASDVLLPAATKGYVAVAQAETAHDRFDQTQIGQLLGDDAMDAFVESLRKQLTGKFGVIQERLGITWDDLEGVPSGELSLAIIERPGRDAALAITMDVTGRGPQAEALIAAVEKRFTGRGGSKRTVQSAGTTLLVFDVPAADPNAPLLQTVYFVRDNVLCGVNGRDEAEAMLKRFAGTPQDNLQSVVAYQETMERCRQEARGLQPEIRWFAEPFGLTWAARTLNKSVRLRHDKDMAKILQGQGFDAMQGVGGFVNMLAPGRIDFLYRVAIYAPPAKGKENDRLRWNLAMRMLQLPNASALVPQSWVPRMSARYATYNIDILNAFDHVGTLFDAVEGHEDAFKTSMEGIEQDAYGPQVNVRNELIAHMGQRVTVVTDYDTPISVKSERSIFAIEAKDEQRLAATVAKIMKKEPDVERRVFGQYVIWERVPVNVGIQELQIDAPGLNPLRIEEEPLASEDEEREHVLPNSAVCVALGQLMMASDIEFLKELLGGFGQRDMLVSAGDYQQVAALMDRVAPGPRSGWSFVRTDEAFRPTYELVRQDRMPEAETMFGKFLNEMLTTEVEKEEGVRRKQRVDGGSLPNFEMVRRYFGPAGRVLRSDRDGWLLTGVVLDKEAP